MGKTPIYPPMPATIRRQLDHVLPSFDGMCVYSPCSVLLENGTSLPRVLFTAQHTYIQKWGVYPAEDLYKREVLVQKVKSVQESPFRLPPQFANKIYEHGESGMGYVVFTVQFKDGSRQAYMSGNVADFVRYPEGKSARDVREVEPHVGRDQHPWQTPDYLWCLYSDDETLVAHQRGLLASLHPRPTILQRIRWTLRRRAART